MKFNDFLQYVEKGKAVTSLTAFRDDLSLEENRKRNDKLASSIRSAGWGFNKIIGHYFPCERWQFKFEPDESTFLKFKEQVLRDLNEEKVFENFKEGSFDEILRYFDKGKKSEAHEDSFLDNLFECYKNDNEDEAYEQTKIIEESFLIVNNDIINNINDQARLKKFALHMCTKYEQNSLFYRTEDGQNLIIKKDGEEDSKTLLSVDKLGDIYSKMKGQTYSFDVIEEYADLWRGMVGAMARHAVDKMLAKSNEEVLEKNNRPNYFFTVR